MLRYLHRAVIAHEGRIAGLSRMLADEARSSERLSLQAMIERETIASETAAGASRIIWYLRTNKSLHQQLRRAVEAEQGFDDAEPEEMRYE